MTAPKNKPATNRKDRPVGENCVWLASMGLAVGLFMIVGLLGLIIWNGAQVFWPHDVVLVTLKESAEPAVPGNRTFAGIVTEDRLLRVKAHNGAEGAREYQFFVGNKDAYGFAFKFVPASDIAQTEKPEDLYVAERVEFGDAIFFPQALKLRDGRVIPANDSTFGRELRALIDEGNRRREQIVKLEREEIGDLNSELETVALETRALTQRFGTDANAHPDMALLRARQKDLQARYDALAQQARALRAQQGENLLVYRLASGQELSLPTGNLINVYQPNRMGTVQKLAFFADEFWAFLSQDPREANTEGGIFPALFGTFIMTLLMSAAVVPFGVVAAIYLREYATQGQFVRAVRIAVNNLAGVPSIVYGVFGLGFFVYMVGGQIDALFFSDRLPTPTFGTGGILWAAFTLALMTVPVVIVATEEALAAVPRGIREASLACGASKWQTIQRIVLPAAAPGVLTGLILAMARGAGEVAPLMLVGVVKLAPNLPLDLAPPFLHLDRKFMHLGFHIYDLGFQSPDSEAAKPMVFATTFLLIVLVVTLNLGAIIIRDRLRKRYATGTF